MFILYRYDLVNIFFYNFVVIDSRFRRFQSIRAGVARREDSGVSFFEAFRVSWNDGRFYYFKVHYSGESDAGSTLYVVNINNTALYDWAMSGTYYKDYIREKKDRNEDSYTYRDFVKEKEAEHTGGVSVPTWKIMSGNTR